MPETQTKTVERPQVLPPELPTNHLPARVVQQVRTLPDGEVVEPVHSPTPNLAKALADAQKKVRCVANDAEVDFPSQGGRVKYKYPSWKAIIEEAKFALADSGIAILPLGADMGYRGAGVNTYLVMERDVIIQHVSGEEKTVHLIWPIVTERGMSVNKAFQAAITSSLRTYLRDLLQMPYADPQEDMEQHHAQPEKPKQQPAPKPSPPKDPPLTVEEQAAVQPFVDWLAKLPDLAGVNYGLRDLAQMEGRAKAAAWDLIRTYCHKYGWQWDKAQKAWFEPQKEMPT